MPFVHNCWLALPGLPHDEVIVLVLRHYIQPGHNLLGMRERVTMLALFDLGHIDMLWGVVTVLVPVLEGVTITIEVRLLTFHPWISFSIE